jgi:hypothetical protein
VESEKIWIKGKIGKGQQSEKRGFYYGQKDPESICGFKNGDQGSGENERLRSIVI